MLNVSAIIFRIVGNITEYSTKVFTDIAVQQKTILCRRIGLISQTLKTHFKRLSLKHRFKKFTLSFL